MACHNFYIYINEHLQDKLASVLISQQLEIVVSSPAALTGKLQSPLQMSPDPWYCFSALGVLCFVFVLDSAFTNYGLLGHSACNHVFTSYNKALI